MMQKICDVRAISLKKNILHKLQFYLFVSFLQWWLRFNSDEQKTTLKNLKRGAFYLPFVFCSGQSHLVTRKHKQSKHKQTSSNFKHIGNIKQLEVYLTCHISQNNKVNHIVGNLLCKNRCKCLSVIWNDLCLKSNFSFSYIWPLSTLTCILQASNLRNKTEKFVRFKPTSKVIVWVHISTGWKLFFVCCKMLRHICNI